MYAEAPLSNYEKLRVEACALAMRMESTVKHETVVGNANRHGEAHSAIRRHPQVKLPSL
jgi:hypothetical protein